MFVANDELNLYKSFSTEFDEDIFYIAYQLVLKTGFHKGFLFPFTSKHDVKHQKKYLCQWCFPPKMISLPSLAFPSTLDF